MKIPGASKEYRQQYEKLEALGCKVGLTRSNHVSVYEPNGGPLVGFFPLTSTNHHTLRKLKLIVRRLSKVAA